MCSSDLREDMQAQAKRLAPAWAKALGEGWTTGVRDCASQIGSGALPLDALPSAALFATPNAKQKGRALDALSKQLRALEIPIIGRIHEDALQLDLRCLEDEPAFLAQLQKLDA